MASSVEGYVSCGHQSSFDWLSAIKDVEGVVLVTDEPCQRFLEKNTDFLYVFFVEPRNSVYAYLEMNGASHVHYSELLKAEEYEQVRNEADSAWKSFRSRGKAYRVNCYKYSYLNHLFPILFWEVVIRKILSVKCDCKFFISTRHVELKAEDIATLAGVDLNQHFLQWALLSTLRDALSGFQVEITRYPVTDILGRDTGLRRKEVAFQIRLAAERIVNLIMKMMDTTYLPAYIRRIRSYLSRWGNKRRPLLLITQALDSAHLEGFLSGRGIPFRQKDYGLFHKEIASICNSIPFQVDNIQVLASSSPRLALEYWLTHLGEHHTKGLDLALPEYLSVFHPLIVTDAEFDPIINRINEIVSESKGLYQICTIPEGAMCLFNQDALDADVLREHDNLKRLLCSKLDLEEYKSQSICNSFRGWECGYDTALRASKWMSNVLRLTLTHNQEKGSTEKTIVFFNFPYIYSHDYLFRGYMISNIAKRKKIAALLSLLDVDRYTVLVSTRGLNNMAFNGDVPSNVFVSSLHWSVLARCADFCIVDDSSIGPEILNMNIPVLKWRPDQIGTDLFAYINSKNYYAVDSLGDLKDVLERLSDLPRVDASEEVNAYFLGSPNYNIMPRLIQHAETTRAMALGEDWQR